MQNLKQTKAMEEEEKSMPKQIEQDLMTISKEEEINVTRREIKNILPKMTLTPIQKSMDTKCLT